MGLLDRFRSDGNASVESDGTPDDSTESKRSPSRAWLVIESAFDHSRQLVNNFTFYYENQRMAAYFVIYSILVSILLSSLALYTDNVSLMLKICFIYALTAVPFLFWLGQAVNDGKIDPQEFK